uniref:Uncharacterized protein n=1 Tax=Anopheles dirus TaxID=7168 RepID=A0A182NBF3_9DIPT
YEQGLEDYDEAADRAEREQQQKQKEQSVEQQYNNMVKPMLTLFNVISTVLSSGRSMRSTAERTAAAGGGDDDDDGGNKTEIITFGEKSTSGANGTGGETATAVAGGRYIKGDPLNGYYDFVISEGSYKFWVVFQLFTAAIVMYATFAAIYYSKVSPLTSDYDYIDYLNGARSFAVSTDSTAAAEGRYIKGDPLNGYYDFVISEGSYKFWAVFQLVTAAVVIYSTLTAIYYSKVAPLTSDYDYIDYLNGGRSFAGARPLDEATRSGVQARAGRAPGWSWDGLSTGGWFGPAAQAFAIVMDAIERRPQ